MFFRHRKSEFCLKFQWFEGCCEIEIVTYIIKIEENTRNWVFFLFPAGHFFSFFLDIKRKPFLRFFWLRKQKFTLKKTSGTTLKSPPEPPSKNIITRRWAKGLRPFLSSVFCAAIQCCIEKFFKTSLCSFWKFFQSPHWFAKKSS